MKLIKSLSRTRIVIALILLFLLIIIILFTGKYEPRNIETAKSDHSKISNEIVSHYSANSSITYSPDKKGYVKLIDEKHNKKIMYLKGSPFEMGYQHGYLMAEGVQQMVNNYIAECIGWLATFKSNLGNDKPQRYIISNSFKSLIHSISLSFCKDNQSEIPKEYIEEMKGIAAGATDAGYDVSYEQVLNLNMAFEIILSFSYPPVSAIRLLSAFTPKEGEDRPHACDGFIAYNRATVGGDVLFGRDLMIVGGSLVRYGLPIIYEPDKGYRFVSVSGPGFVGVITGMNSEGLGLGINMLTALDSKPFRKTMGAMLIARQAIQYKPDLKNTAEFIKNVKRSTPFLYIIGDGRGKERGGSVLESSALHCVERPIDYKFPASFKDPDAKQIEDKDDLLVVANHMINPYTNKTLGGKPQEDSLNRYKELIRQTLEAYGKINIEKGLNIVNYLSPAKKQDWMPGGTYYGTNPNIDIDAHRVLFNLTTLEAWSLYGTYAHPWVYLKL